MYWSLENVPWTNLHDLNLDWIVNTMKQTVEQWIAYRTEMNQNYANFTEQINSDFDDFTEQINDWKTQVDSDFADLQVYVQDYFDNLDLNESTRYVINQMIASGEFIQVLNPSIVSATEAWLASHVTPTTPVLDDTLTISGAAADAKATGDAIKTVDNNLDYITTVGFNLFDPATAIQGKRVNTNGIEQVASDFYCSPYIPVQANTSYKTTYGLGSSTILTLAFYDENKDFISGHYQNPSTPAFSVTTPANCSFIRINGTLSRLNNQQFYLSAVSNIRPYRLIVNGVSSVGVYLQSSYEIFFDPTTGMLQSKGSITLITPNGTLNYGNTVNVGSNGVLLLVNTDTGLMYTSNSIPTTPNVYLLASFRTIHQSLKPNLFIDSAFPIFNVDQRANTLNIYVKNLDAYLFYNGVFYTISAGFTQTVDISSDNCIVVYEPYENTFKMVNDFNAYTINSGIVVFSKYYRNLWCVSKYETVIYNDTYYSMACFGDSLTWYDGHAYTWGEHVGEICKGFETYILNELNVASVANFGASGYTTPQICSALVSSSAVLSRKVVLIMGGDNDDRLNVPIGTIQPYGSAFDTSTVIGALQNAIEHLYAQVPEMRIILMTEPMGWIYRSGALERVNENFPNAYRAVAAYYGLPVIDLWKESGINEGNRDYFYADPPAADNTLYMFHPNDTGWVLLSKIIIKRLKELI